MSKLKTMISKGIISTFKSAWLRRTRGLMKWFDLLCGVVIARIEDKRKNFQRTVIRVYKILKNLWCCVSASLSPIFFLIENHSKYLNLRSWDSVFVYKKPLRLLGNILVLGDIRTFKQFKLFCLQGGMVTGLTLED